MIIIGIAGKSGHGKDTAANLLVTRHGYTRIAYADALRHMLELGLGIEQRWLTTDKNQVIPWLGVTGRHLMQTLGTEWGRHLVCEDIWRRALINRIEGLSGVTDRIVISDVRFQNEADWVRSVGQLWHIVCVNPTVPLEGAAADHISETGIRPHTNERLLYNRIPDLNMLANQIDLGHERIEHRGSSSLPHATPSFASQINATTLFS